MDEEPKHGTEADSVWRYRALSDKFKPEAPEPSSEENRTLVGLRAVQGRGVNPYLPQSVSEPEPPPKDRDQRHDFMAP